MEETAMALHIVSGTAHRGLAEALAGLLGVQL